MTSRLGYMFCLSVFLLPQLASSQPSPSASPKQQLLDDLRQVEQDPIDIKLVNNIHYVATAGGNAFYEKRPPALVTRRVPPKQVEGLTGG